MQSIYTHLCSRLVGVKELRKQPIVKYLDEEELDDELEIISEGVTNVSQISFEEVCQFLADNLNVWLSTASFAVIDAQLRSQLDRESEIQVTLETNDEEFICKCQQVLTEVVGPIAIILMQQVLNSGDNHSGYVNSDRQKLIEALAAKIPDSQLRNKFYQEICQST